MRSSELILNTDLSVYHLALKAGEVAPQIISVGDPERLEMFVPYMDSITLRRQKREFYTLTGTYLEMPLTIISTGIGTDNIDIVFTELDALFNIDLEARRTRDTLTQLKWLRLGTSGTIQKDIPLDSYISSRYAIGADGLMEYYEFPVNKALQIKWNEHAQQMTGLPSGIYLAEGTSQVSPHLPPNTVEGITYTAKGFYGPQGRYIERTKLRFPKLVDEMAAFQFSDYRTTNMEMETAGIFGMANALGHQAASLSVILANRQLGTFSADPQKAVKKLVKDGLKLMYKWYQAEQ